MAVAALVLPMPISPKRDQGATLRGGFGSQIDAHVQSGVQLGFRHGSFAGEVAGSAPHLAMH